MTTSAKAAAGPLPTLRGIDMTMREHAALKPRAVPEILRDGLAAHGSCMVLRAMPSTMPRGQRAVVASRKLGGAVTRNRAKRRLREAIRAAAVPTQLDIVLIARGTALTAPMTQLVREVEDLVARVRDRVAPGGTA